MIDADEAANEDDITSSAKIMHILKLPDSSIICMKDKCGSTRLRRRWQKAQCNIPQHAPLYAALFCSIVAVTFSIRTHLSTRFVSLEEPLRVSPFFKNVDYIGLSTWELCAIRQDALDAIIADGTEEEDDTNISAVVAKLPLSTVMTITDQQRKVTSHVMTTYHYTPTSIKQSNSWMEEPDHDDILVSADFPYNDDDAFESNLPAEYWSCHLVKINSKSAGDDIKWNVSRAFFMMGSIMGIVSTCLLVALIVFRVRDAEGRLIYQREVKNEIIQQNQNCDPMQQQSSGDDNVMIQPETVVSQPYQTLSVPNDLLSLDIDSSGYRPVSICFLLSYLLQSFTLLFLDSEICRDQVCSISTGAHGLLAACVLWVVTGILVLFMMTKIRRNERRVWRFERKKSNRALAMRGETAMQSLQISDDAIDGDTKSLLPMIPEEICNSIDSGKEDTQTIDEDSVLNTTADTECSDFSLPPYEED